MGTIVKLADWPVVKTETNRERIIRALREADMPQCKEEYAQGAARCALGAMGEVIVGDAEYFDSTLNSLKWGLTQALKIGGWNDDDSLTFAQIADRLEADDSYWNEKGDEVWER